MDPRLRLSTPMYQTEMEIFCRNSGVLVEIRWRFCVDAVSDRRGLWGRTEGSQPLRAFPGQIGLSQRVEALTGTMCRGCQLMLAQM